jgi:glycosyltransferase involved in cell wall biosynthesis
MRGTREKSPAVDSAPEAGSAVRSQSRFRAEPPAASAPQRPPAQSEDACSRRPTQPTCSVVIPAYNEEGCLRPLHARLSQVLQDEGLAYEILFVDDGSTDQTLPTVRQLAVSDPHVRWISFSRNFGHEAASTAGIDHARGDVVILMDADLQDPPELIPEILMKWRAGYDVVYARRRRREGESRFKRATAWLFYRALNAMTQVPIPMDTGDFRLMDRAVVNEFRRLREQNRFVRGLVSWVGLKQAAVAFDRPARVAGEPKYSVVKLAALSLDAIVSFSIVPLRLISLLGLLVLLLTGVACLGATLGWALLDTELSLEHLLVAGLFFLGGVQLVCLGVVAEYIGRLYRQSQQRPLYVVAESRGSGLPTERSDEPAAHGGLTLDRTKVGQGLT